VPRVRDLLYRFRPAGAPGAASAAGVPVDRGADLAAELEPLFAQLADTEDACTAIREQARGDAERIRARETERARGIVAAANARTQAERAAATAQLRQRAETESSALLAAAEQEAAAVRERAAEQMPAYVAQVVASVRGLLGEDESGAGAT
jgi:hypothetical protein